MCVRVRMIGLLLEFGFFLDEDWVMGRRLSLPLLVLFQFLFQQRDLQTHPTHPHTHFSLVSTNMSCVLMTSIILVVKRN